MKPVLNLASLVLLLGLSACIPDRWPDAPTAWTTSTQSPTVTPAPMAFMVNDEAILQEEFEAEVLRYLQVQAEMGQTVTPEEASQAVQDDLIDQILLAQNAGLNGYTVDDATLQARLDALAAEVGGEEALSAWQAANGYSEQGFRDSLRRLMAAAWMRDRVIAEIPSTAEQVHVRQIRFNIVEEAQDVYALLEAGSDFNELAAEYEPLTLGDLGWFPRGYLDHPAIEEAVFALQPGEYSTVVESSVGFHILYLVERETSRLLSPDALLTLQERHLLDWLTQQRNASTIVTAP